MVDTYASTQAAQSTNTACFDPPTHKPAQKTMDMAHNSGLKKNNAVNVRGWSTVANGHQPHIPNAQCCCCGSSCCYCCYC